MVTPEMCLALGEQLQSAVDRVQHNCFMVAYGVSLVRSYYYDDIVDNVNSYANDPNNMVRIRHSNLNSTHAMVITMLSLLYAYHCYYSCVYYHGYHSPQ